MLDIEFLRYLVKRTKDSDPLLIQCAKKLEVSLWSTNNRLTMWNILKQKNMTIDLRMQWACLLGLTDQVKLLAEQGADVNKVDYSYFETTPLKIATQNNHPQVVNLLLRKGAEVDKAGSSGVTALYIAAGNGYYGLVTLLHEHGAILNKRGYGVSILYHAASCGRYDVVNFLILHGIDVNEENTGGSTPLHGAAYGGHDKVVELLLYHRAKVNQPACNGLTPLHSAVLGGHVETIRLLVTSGAKVNSVISCEGDTPIHIAASRDDLDAIKLLTKAGADINRTNAKGYPPLHIAVLSGHISVVRYLLENGAHTSLYTLSRTGLYRNNETRIWKNTPGQLRAVLIKAIGQSTTLFSLTPFPEYFTLDEQKEILSILKQNRKIERYYRVACQLIDQSLNLYNKELLTKEQMDFLSNKLIKFKQKIANLSPTALQLNRIDEYLEFKQVIFCYCLENTPEDAIEYLHEMSDLSSREIQETLKFLIVHCYGDHANWKTKAQKKYYLGKIIDEVFVHVRDFDADLNKILAYCFWHLLYPDGLDNPGLTLSSLWEQSEPNELKKLPPHRLVLGVRVLLQNVQNTKVLATTIDLLIDIPELDMNQDFLLTCFTQFFIKHQKLPYESSIKNFEELCNYLPSDPFLRKNSSVSDKRKVIIGYYKNFMAAAPSVATVSMFENVTVTNQEQYEVKQLGL